MSERDLVGSEYYYYILNHVLGHVALISFWIKLIFLTVMSIIWWPTSLALNVFFYYIKVTFILLETVFFHFNLSKEVKLILQLLPDSFWTPVSILLLKWRMCVLLTHCTQHTRFSGLARGSCDSHINRDQYKPGQARQAYPTGMGVPIDICDTTFRAPPPREITWFAWHNYSHEGKFVVEDLSSVNGTLSWHNLLRRWVVNWLRISFVRTCLRPFSTPTVRFSAGQSSTLWIKNANDPIAVVRTWAYTHLSPPRVLASPQRGSSALPHCWEFPRQIRNPPPSPVPPLPSIPQERHRHWGSPHPAVHYQHHQH